MPGDKLRVVLPGAEDSRLARREAVSWVMWDEGGGASIGSPHRDVCLWTSDVTAVSFHSLVLVGMMNMDDDGSVCSVC